MIHWAVFDDAGESYAVPSGKPAGWPEPSKKLLRIVFLRREPIGAAILPPHFVLEKQGTMPTSSRDSDSGEVRSSVPL